MTSQSIVINQKQLKNFSCFKISNCQSGIREIYKGYSEKEIQETIKKELISLSSSGHEVYGPVPLRLLSQED